MEPTPELKIVSCAESMYLGPCKRKFLPPWLRQVVLHQCTTSLQQSTRESKRPWNSSEEKRTGSESQLIQIYSNSVETVRHVKPPNLLLPLRLHWQTPQSEDRGRWYWRYIPVSSNNNRYILVVQDYFTKWVEAITLPDQTAAHITKELVKPFSTFGCPDIWSRTKLWKHNSMEHTERDWHLEISNNCIPTPRRLNGWAVQQIASAAATKLCCTSKWFLPLVLFTYRMATHQFNWHSRWCLDGLHPHRSSHPPLRATQQPTQTACSANFQSYEILLSAT